MNKQETSQLLIQQMLKDGYYKTKEDAVFEALRHHFHDLINGKVKSEVDMYHETVQGTLEMIKIRKAEMN